MALQLDILGRIERVSRVRGEIVKLDLVLSLLMIGPVIGPDGKVWECVNDWLAKVCVHLHTCCN